MKFCVVFVICCGVALAYNPMDDCIATDSEIGRVVENTRTHATALMLWSMCRILGIFLSLPQLPDQNRQLNNSITAPKEKYQISQVVARLLEIFIDQKNKDASSSPIILNEESFRTLENTINNAVVYCETFSFRLTRAFNSNNLTGYEAQQLNDSGETLYLRMHMAMVSFVSFSPNYRLKAIATFNKLSSKLEEMLPTLEKSIFGQSITPLIQRIRTILAAIGFLFKLPLSELTNERGTNDKEIFYQFVIITLHDLYSLKNLYDTISYVTWHLETGNADTVAQLSLPQDNGIENALSLLDRNYSKLRTVLNNVNSDLQLDNAFYPDLIKRFLRAIFQIEPITFELDKQLHKILKALKIPKDDALLYEENLHEMVPSALEQEGSDYDIQYEYNKTVEKIDNTFLQIGTQAVLLTRRMWRTLARQLLHICVGNMTYQMNDILTNIIQRLTFPAITAYLTEIQTFSNRQVAVDFDTMNNFEEAVTHFIEMLKSLQKSDKHKILSSKQKTLDERAQKVFSTIHLVLYELKAVFALDQNSVLEAALEDNEEIMKLLNESNTHSNLRDSVKTIATIIQEISSHIQSLLKLFKDFEENHTKRTALSSVIYQFVGTCNFVISTKGLLYVAKFLNKFDEHDDVGTLNQEALQKAHNSLANNLNKRKFVIKTAEEMCEDDMADSKRVVEQISLQIWAINGDSIILREQIRDILRALPRPPEDNPDFGELCGTYNDLNRPFELLPPNNAYAIDENDVPIVQSGEIVQRMDSLESTEQWVRNVKRMMHSYPDTVVGSLEDAKNEGEEDVETAIGAEDETKEQN